MKAQVKSKLNTEGRVDLQDVIPLETPFLLYVDPSSACNFRCQFCPTGHIDLLKASEYKRRVLDFALFEKIIRDVSEFPDHLRVMRLNKIGEPLLNKNLPDMVRLAKQCGRIDYIDLATNASLFNEGLLEALIEAGLDRLNVSLEGIDNDQYRKHAKVDVNFDEIIKNIKWLYQNKGGCEISIKIPGNYLSEKDREIFFDIFGNYCDRIFIEELSPIWPEFDVEERAHVKITQDEGQYRQKLEEKEVCTYIFYAMAVNADGTVSACCPDWDQKLLIGDARRQSLREIWGSDSMRKLQKLHLKGLRETHPVCASCGHVKFSQQDNIDDFKEIILMKIFKE
ncbi:MAG: radical SAM protein [Methanobacterium sp.]|nr:radical SAM protein [Methanobacterium sp.]